MNDFHCQSKEQGSVLIFSVWVLCMLFCLALSLSYRARINLRLATYEWDEIRLVQAIKMEAQDSVSFWRKSSVFYSSLNQPWSNTRGMQDENARIQLNKASGDILTQLFTSHSSVVPEILRWRSPGSGGDDYSGLGYGCRHGPFKAVEELLLVKGITPEIFDDVKDYLTVDTDGGININTASVRVLESVGLTPSLATKIFLFRQGPDGKDGTSDDGVFDQVNTIIPRLKASTFVSGPELQSLTNTLRANRLTVQSSAVRMDILAHLNDSPARRHAVVVASGRSSGARILQWRERYL